MEPQRQFTINLYFPDDMPESIKAFCFFDAKKAEYGIAINNNKSEIMQAGSFLHEMLHIYKNDFESSMSVGQIELETHQLLAAILRNLEEDPDMYGK